MRQDKLDVFCSATCLVRKLFEISYIPSGTEGVAGRNNGVFGFVVLDFNDSISRFDEIS